jgi:purine-cytosine permease-like protein
VATARYSFGFWGAKICSLLNVTASIGFSVVNIVVCGQLLSAVSDHKLTIDVGIIIIQVLSYSISIFGFAFIHSFEKYSWVLIFVLLSVLIGQTVPRLNPSTLSVSTTQHGIASPLLSFIAINFSSTSGWSTVVADYYCNYSSNTPAWKLCLLTVFGIAVPTIFTTVIGSCLGELALNTSDSIYREEFSKHGLGGLLQAVYHPVGFSKFSLVMLMFSVLGNNVVSCYSSGLSIQLLGDYFHAIPRLLWSLFVAVASAVLAMAGKDSLAAVVQNFVSLLGYWTVCFTMILLVEDKWFRRKVGYDISAWDQPKQLPIGIGAVVSFLTGYLAGGVVGMNQTWYVGPIAAKFGSPGGDVGEFLAAAFTCSTYFVVRSVEKQIFGK